MRLGWVAQRALLVLVAAAVVTGAVMQQVAAHSNIEPVPMDTQQAAAAPVGLPMS